MNCALIQNQDLQCIVGDASRDGVGSQQYCGLWSLTSKYHVFNAFGNSFAGLIPSEIRGKSPTLEHADDESVTLIHTSRPEHPVDVKAEYRLGPVNHIDHTLSFTDREDRRIENCSFREVSYCCYMNCPADPRLNFKSEGEWISYISPRHGVGANIAPSYVPDNDLEVWPIQSDWREKRLDDRPFHWDRYEHKFDLPFYYGRLAHMVFILIFDTPRQLRFFCSPSGGGSSFVTGQTCPAWDHEWIIPEEDYEVGREYTFRTRLVYKPYVSDDDVMEEYRRAVDELGLEGV